MKNIAALTLEVSFSPYLYAIVIRDAMTVSREEQEILEQIELLRKERELLGRLSEIRTKHEFEAHSNGKAQRSTQPTLFVPEGSGIAKGEFSWDKYVLIIASKLSRSKSNDIKDYARKANPGVADEVIDRSVTNSLYTLKKDGKISFKELGTRKDGYEWYVTEEQKKAANL